MQLFALTLLITIVIITDPISSVSIYGAGNPLPNQYIVMFKSTASNNDINQFYVKLDTSVIIQYKYDSVIKGFSATIPPSILAQIKANPIVDRVDPVTAISLEPTNTGVAIR